MIEIQRIANVRDDLIRIGNTVDPQDTIRVLAEITGPTLTLIEQIKDLDHSEWEILRGNIARVDSTLLEVVTSVRNTLEKVSVHISLSEPFRFSTRVVQVQGGSFLHLDSGTPIIRLLFKTASGKIIVSDQDFEDTLAVGAGILELVAGSGKSISEKLGGSLQNVVLGDDLAERLDMIENATRDIRRLHELKRGVEDATDSGDRHN